MPDAPHHDDLGAVRSAAERFATAETDEQDLTRSAVERALPPVLATLVGGTVLALLGGLVGVLSLSFPAVLVGVAVVAGAGWRLLQLSEQQARRDTAEADARRAARERREAAGAELVEAVGAAVAHVERLDAERDRLAGERKRLERERAALHGKIDRLERRLSAKERKLARVQAFDAERRTLEPAPVEEPMAGQLTFDAVASD